MAASTMFGQSQLDQEIQKYRYELQWENNQIAGPGADVLKKAVSEAQFVLIGEQHGTAQTPAFASSICDIAISQGFNTMALETSESIAEKLEQAARSDNPTGEIADLEREFPGAIPFYNLKEETDLLSHCSSGKKGDRFHFWGLDQEYIGSGRFLLTNLLASHPGNAAESEIRKLLREDSEAYKKLADSGDFKNAFLLSASESELRTLQHLIEQGANPASKSLMDAFLQSRDVYEKSVHGQNYESNHERSRLMKEALLTHYEESLHQTGIPPKVLFKFGAAHLYRGMNPLHNDDLGNFVSEFAEGHGRNSLHIMLVGAKGEAANFGIPGHPVQPEHFNLDLESDAAVAFIKPFLKARLKNAWTLYDLRPLRDHHNSISGLNAEIDQLIFGYDILIVVPEVTPAKEIVN